MWPSAPLSRCCAHALLALAAALGGCDLTTPGAASGDAAAVHRETVEARLQGSWVRQDERKGIRSRRILVLEPGGAFRETVRVTDLAGAVTEHLHEGIWFFDGTNFKRRYTLMNGEPPSRLNVPFVTFEIRFEGRNAFVGIDHIHRNRVHYERVQPETAL